MSSAFVAARPSFHIDGRARADVAEAVLALSVALPLAGGAHAELHLSNWGVPEGGSEPDFVLEDIDLGARVRIGFDAGEGRVQVFDGEITAIEDRYGEGAPQRVWLLQDGLHRMARVRHSRSFEAMSADDVVAALAADAGLSTDCALSSATATWNQLNESDLALLLRLARRFDIAPRLHQGHLRVRAEEADPEPRRLVAQDGVLALRLICDLNHQPRGVWVTGYDLARDSDTAAHDTALSPAPAGETAASVLERLGWGGDSLLARPFASTGMLAREQAAAGLRRIAGRFVHGELRCVGDPTLHAGREIELGGVAPRLRGRYRVAHCEHRFDNRSGFETRLALHRADRERA